MKIVRVVLSVLGLLCAFIFLLPLFLHAQINLGTIVGFGIGIILIVLGIFLQQIVRLIRILFGKRWGKILLAAFGLFFVAGIALISVETVLMVRAANKVPADGATVVVLGCRVYDGKPSKTLQSRLDVAYDYLIEHENSSCVVSGGKGSNEPMTEAECMYKYLVDRGISPERIYMEDQSRTTRENLKFSMQVIEDNHLNPSIAIVTSEFHQYRAGLIADSLGISYGAISSHTSMTLLPTYYVREWFGIVYQWIGIGE